MFRQKYIFQGVQIAKVKTSYIHCSVGYAMAQSVEALRRKPQVRGVHFRSDHWIFH